MPGPIIPAAQTDDDDEQPTSPLVQQSDSDDDKGASGAQAPAAPAPPPAPASGYEAVALPAAPAMPPATPTGPTAPIAFTPDTAKLQQLQSKAQADRQPVTVAPKWYDRLAGALVGFGTGYREGPTAGIEAGSQITDRRQIAANAAQEKQLAADESAIGDFNQANATAQQGADNLQRNYEDQVRNTELQNQEDQNQWDRGFRTTQANREQSNTDRDFNQRVTDSDRNYENVLDNEQREQGNADRNYGLEERRVGIDAARERLEERDASQRDAGTQATQLRQKMAANTLDQQRQRDYDILENGDGKGNEGYHQQLKDLQDPNAINPATSKKYTAEERADAIADMNAGHLAAKQRIEDNYATQMNNLGIPVQRVVYDSSGNAINNSDGSRAGQNAPPPAQSQPQQQPPNPAAALPKPKSRGQALDVGTAKQYLAAANGDKAKARQLAATNGWKF